MEISDQVAQAVLLSIQKAQKILIISHRSPDADSIGSNLGLRYVMQAMGKDVTSACIDPLPTGCDFLPYANEYLQDFNYQDYDLLCSVDCGSISQTSFLDKYPEILEQKYPFLNIDHHPSNNNYGTINFVIDNAASTTLMLYHLFKKWGVAITPAIATCLMFGLYYDTGSFMHSNTNEDVYQTAAELMKLGAKKQLIINSLYKQSSIEKLHVWGKVLSQARMTKENVIVSGITNDELNNLNATQQDISGLIDYLSMAKNNKFAALLAEDGKGNIKGSFRTKRDDINVSDLAGNFGGGGHKKASGFTVKGSLKKNTRWEIASN